MTPDITIRGRMPTEEQYRASLELLAEISACGLKGLQALRVMSLDRIQTDAWIALFNAGILESRTGPGGWDHVRLTRYGNVYWGERKPLPEPQQKQQPVLPAE